MQPQNFFQENFLSIIFLAAIILYGFVSVRRALQQRDLPIEEDTTTTDRLVYHGDELDLSDEDVSHILSTYHSYYSNISAELQTAFKERLQKFMRQKTFIIYAKEGYKEMPVLTSAAAIQVSFGLDKFLLPWFPFIQIHIEEYFDGDSLKVLNGGIEGNAITVAWNQLIKGNEDAADGENVGIHEMAHALYYQNVVVEKKEADFKKHFYEVMEQGRKIFDQRDARPAVFNEYAYKNLQEFWAESVEMFFERPAVMQAACAELFTILKQLLRQDPLNKSNPLLEIPKSSKTNLF